MKAALAVYETNDLTGGAWDQSDNGTYAIRVLGGRVAADSGIAIEKRTIGTLSVRVA